jgi:hypothetical protein
VCGCGNQKTAWWNEEIIRMVKVRKQLWKRYLTTKMVEDYEKCKVQRNLLKEKVMKAKQRAWEDFGTKMEEDYQGNQKLFCRVIRNMRKETETPIKFIKDKSGNLLTTDREGNIGKMEAVLSRAMWG